MRATVSKHEPHILREVEIGRLFSPYDPRYSECICALAIEPAIAADGEYAEVVRRAYREESFALAVDATRQVVVVACRVTQGEPGFHFTGTVFALRGDSPVAYLEQIEPLALREQPEPSPYDLAQLVDAIGGREVSIPSTGELAAPYATGL